MTGYWLPTAKRISGIFQKRDEIACTALMRSINAIGMPLSVCRLGIRGNHTKLSIIELELTRMLTDARAPDSSMVHSKCLLADSTFVPPFRRIFLTQWWQLNQKLTYVMDDQLQRVINFVIFSILYLVPMICKLFVTPGIVCRHNLVTFSIAVYLLIYIYFTPKNL